MAERPDEQSTIVPTEEEFPRRYALEQTPMPRIEEQLGRISGAFANIFINIAGACLILLILPLFFMLFFPSNLSSIEYVQSVLPLMTLVLGYLFGKST
jgi:hypothetical protein